MGRLLELIFLAFLLWLAWEGVKARIRAFLAGEPPSPPKSSAGRPAPPSRREETLVRCAACGTHVPESRALPGPPDRPGSSDRYCSERCQRA